MKTQFSQKEAAELFKSLADENRLRIVHALFANRKCVTDLVEELSLSQSHISHHLKTLKVVGIVYAERDGHKMYYAISPKVKKSVLKSGKGVLNLGCCEIKFS